MEKDSKQWMEVCAATNRFYDRKFKELLKSVPEGSLTDDKVILMIMNCTVEIAKHCYFSLKDFLPTTVMDFKFIRASVINKLKDRFEEILAYVPNPETIPLTVEQVKEVREKGFTMMAMPDGSKRKITLDDILVKKDEADKIIQTAKKEIMHHGPNPNAAKKIIVPGSTTF